MYEVEIKIKVTTNIDKSLVYNTFKTEAGKAVDTVKNKIIAVFGENTTFEDSCVREIEE